MPEPVYSIEVAGTGAEKLAALGARMQEMGAGELRRKLLARLRLEGAAAVPALRDSALNTLPRAGGLADRVAASRIAVRSNLTGRSVGVRIVAVNKSLKDMRDTDSGHLRHPVFGNRKVWVSQDVRPGWWSRPLEAIGPVMRASMVRVIDEVATEIEEI